MHIPGCSQRRLRASPSSSPCPHSWYRPLFGLTCSFWMCRGRIFHFSCIISPFPSGVDAAHQYMWFEIDWRHWPTSSQSFFFVSLSTFLHKPGKYWLQVSVSYKLWGGHTRDHCIISPSQLLTASQTYKAFMIIKKEVIFICLFIFTSLWCYFTICF